MEDARFLTGLLLRRRPNTAVAPVAGGWVVAAATPWSLTFRAWTPGWPAAPAAMDDTFRRSEPSHSWSRRLSQRSTASSFSDCGLLPGCSPITLPVWQADPEVPGRQTQRHALPVSSGRPLFWQGRQWQGCCSARYSSVAIFKWSFFKAAQCTSFTSSWRGRSCHRNTLISPSAFIKPSDRPPADSPHLLTRTVNHSVKDKVESLKQNKRWDFFWFKNLKVRSVVQREKTTMVLWLTELQQQMH